MPSDVESKQIEIKLNDLEHGYRQLAVIIKQEQLAFERRFGSKNKECP